MPLGMASSAGRMRVKRSNMRPHVIDARARNVAQRLADQWRATGLAVDWVEYLGTDTEPGGYGLTARSSTSILSCRCQSWAVRSWRWRRRPLWTISVSVRAAAPEAEMRAAPAQPAGVVAAWEHEKAWDTVQNWIDGTGALPPTLSEALAALR